MAARCSAIVLCLVLLLSIMVMAKNEPLSIGNEYVSITVNNSEDGQGRFSMSTTGGDPSIRNDDAKPLIYGGKDPWTSFTTVRIDGNDYIFGGISNRRAGKKASYGSVVSPPSVKDGAIVTQTLFGDVRVTQKLNLVNSTTTGRPDTVAIEYTLQNNGATDVRVGLRVVIDTMLGQNDGAPFRIPNGSVAKSSVLTGQAVPELWQAFDSLRTPTLRAQGTLRGEGLTPPDAVVFTDWGTLADEPWTANVDSAKGFIRKGEDEPDTATGLVWEPVMLPPGETRSYTTLYGLGGITVSLGDGLLLGVTSPSEIVPRKTGNGEIPIVVYLENGTSKDFQNVVIQVKAPVEVTLAPNQTPQRKLSRLSAFSDYQCGWTLMLNDSVKSGDIAFEVTASSDGKVLNKVTRVVKVVQPPTLAVWSASAPLDGVDGVVRVKAAIKNMGTRRVEGVVATITAPPGLTPARHELLDRHLGYIEPSKMVNLFWTFYRSSATPNVVTISVESENAVDVLQTLQVK